MRMRGKKNIHLPNDPAKLLLGIYPKNVTQVIPKAPARHVYCSTIYNSQAMETHEWIEKMWYLYTMEFYSAMEKNEILSFASKCMELENIILSKVSQAQKAKSHMSPSYIDYRPKTNAVILLDMGHTLREEHAWGK
jgi:hypothetical protein